MDLQQIQPAAFKAMLGLEHYLATTELTKTQKELIKIRASQINHCAYCIDMHTTDALKAGESPRRIFLLDAWRESNAFTQAEKALLAITEAVTHISDAGLPEKVWNEARAHFTETAIAQIVMAVVAINGWNRIGVAFQGQFGDTNS